MDFKNIMQAREELEIISGDVQEKLDRLMVIEKDMKNQEKNLRTIAKGLDQKLSGTIENELFVKFFQKPYTIIPMKNNKALVAVPKFIKGFQVGWLWKETDSFYIYQLDQYSAWLGDIPKDLVDELDLKQEFEAEIVDNQIFFQPTDKEKIRKRLGKHLKDFKENSAKIIMGHEFGIIVDMVESGTLPFKAKKVEQADIREMRSTIKLRDYQEPAFKKFLETGAIGLFHPTGAGKSFISLKCLDIIKGRKLIVVPTRSLVEQWNYLLETYLSFAKNEIDIITYQGYNKTHREEEYILTIFDECQRLPANTFSKLALINTKYRIGLSASPHREDGRESYIFALTGFPVGLNWETYMKETKRTYHPVYVHVVETEIQKINKLYGMVDVNKKTLIFCDKIELGKKISEKLGVPFIYGDTKDRLGIIEQNKVSVVSRVMDLGISIKDLQRIIEIDFLFGSRQQELQRTGRLMHSLEKDVKHDILMTRQELENYGKRLWSLQEKGFAIKIIEEK